MVKIWFAGCAILVSFFANESSAAVTVREITLKNGGTEILLDTTIDKKTVDIDYVRDIVQFSINNATIYPAKMMHAEKASFSKVFAYQYSPNLVRIRFSVDNNAEQFKNKINWSVDGKRISIQFPELKSVPKQSDEQSLLAKITASIDGKEDSKKPETVKAEKTEKAEKIEKNELSEKKEAAAEKTSGSLTGNGKKSVKLGGAKPGPSMFRSFLAMFLVVGGLGMILIYVKRRNSMGGQAKKVNGNSWLSGIFNQKAAQKPLMEVVATHVLGPKQSIVVMKIKGQQFVLAVTAENVQLITQLDADEQELDLLDDPKVAASIGKMFGVNKTAGNQNAQAEKSEPTVNMGSSFNSLLKNSTGAGAIIARNAYASQAPVEQDYASVPAPVAAQVASRGGAIDQIRKRLGNMQ